MTNDILYELRAVRKIYSGRAILDVSELQIPERTITALVGPNGAGKSTLLRLLALIEGPSEGEVFFAGQPVNASTNGPAVRGVGLHKILALRRQVTMVGHAPLLFAGSVFDNVAFGLRVRGVEQSRWPSMIKEALALVELTGSEERSAQSLSAGESQRLALARALVFRPRVILLDEPTANVDASRVSRIEALISEVNLRFGTTVVLSTHNLSQAFGLTGRVVHLAAGRIIDQAHENIFSGEIRHEAGDSWIEIRSGRIHLRTGAQGHVSCMIRPRDIQLVELPLNAERTNQFLCKVTRLELRNGLARLRAEAGVVFRVDAEQEKLKSRGITLGSDIGIAFDPDVVRILE